MAKDPSFPFYASDWLGSTKRLLMTPAQRGAYIDLLAHQWGDATCSLPDNDEELAVLSGLNEGWLNGGSQLVRRCFPPHPELSARIANPRLLVVRAERDDWREKSRQGGLKSARVRAAKAGQQPSCDASKTVSMDNTDGEGDLKGGCNLVGDWLQPKGNSPSPSPSPSSKEVSSKEETCCARSEKRAAEFAQFWKAYPPRNGRRLKRGQAEAEFDKLPEDHVSRVLAAVVNYAPPPGEERVGVMDAFRWLRKPPRGAGDPPWMDWEGEAEEQPAARPTVKLFDDLLEDE